MNLLALMNLISATTRDVMGVVRIVCIALLALGAIAIIILVLLQPSASEGMGAISGQSYDSFYSKNKVRTPEGIMKRVTIVISIFMVVVAIAFFITSIWYV